MSIDFKGAHFPNSVILYAVYFYVRYAVSYRDLQEIMAERGVDVDHATLNRWVVRYSTKIAEQAQKRKHPTLGSWRVDETYIKVKGQWTYLYRAVDCDGKRSISCSLNVETLALHGVSLRKPSQATAFRTRLSLIKVGPIWRERRLSTTS